MHDHFAHVVDYLQYRRGCYLFGAGFPRPDHEAAALGWDREREYYLAWIERSGWATA